jgi:ABC-2 type transport system ATP-binding protein
VICAKEVTKYFGPLKVLENLNCTVERGSIYGLIGYNGAGKTTFLKTVAGIYRPDGGSVQINGHEVFDNAQVKQRIFFIPDEHYFLPQATMDAMARFYKGFYVNWNEKTYRKLTGLFKLDPVKRLNGFSKGMQQQAAIILALATRPDYLLLDECFDGLDPAKRSLVRQLLTELMAEKEMTVMISSHNVRELEDLCDYIGVINERQIVYDSSVCEMREKINKYRVAFKNQVSANDLSSIDHKNLMLDGRVATFVVNGLPEEIKKQLAPLRPALIQVIPLSLEEIFLVEMEEQTYDFKDII